MPEFRRYHVAGATYFFTVVTAGRAPLFLEETARQLLGFSLRSERAERPFAVVAIVLLPDHLHTVWSLPPGDADFSTRWSAIKARFTRSWLELGGVEHRLHPGQVRERRRGVWQPRFIEHMIRDEQDLEDHLNYIHYNPVKHGLARGPREWLWSSFHRYVRLGAYPLDWGCASASPPAGLDRLERHPME